LKKLFIALSVLTVFISAVFVGCGTKEDGEVSTTSTTTTTTTTTTRTTEEMSSSITSDKENLEDKITSAITEMSEDMNR